MHVERMPVLCMSCVHVHIRGSAYVGVCATDCLRVRLTFSVVIYGAAPTRGEHGLGSKGRRTRTTTGATFTLGIRVFCGATFWPVAGGCTCAAVRKVAPHAGRAPPPREAEGGRREAGEFLRCRIGVVYCRCRRKQTRCEAQQLQLSCRFNSVLGGMGSLIPVWNLFWRQMHNPFLDGGPPKRFRTAFPCSDVWSPSYRLSEDKERRHADGAAKV